MLCSECCDAVQRMLRCCAANAAMLCTECCDAMHWMLRCHAANMQRRLRCYAVNAAMPSSECGNAVHRMLPCCAANAMMLCSECCDAACAANTMQQMMRYHATTHHDLHAWTYTSHPPHSSYCVVGSDCNYCDPQP